MANAFSASRSLPFVSALRRTRSCCCFVVFDNDNDYDYDNDYGNDNTKISALCECTEEDKVSFLPQLNSIKSIKY